MTENYSDLLKLSDEEIKKRCNQVAATTQPGLAYFAAELDRRAQGRVNTKLIRLTVATLVVAIIAAILTAIQLLK
jgi:hypothetical protein